MDELTIDRLANMIVSKYFNLSEVDNQMDFILDILKPSEMPLLIEIEVRGLKGKCVLQNGCGENVEGGGNLNGGGTGGKSDVCSLNVESGGISGGRSGENGGRSGESGISDVCSLNVKNMIKSNKSHTNQTFTSSSTSTSSTSLKTLTSTTTSSTTYTSYYIKQYERLDLTNDTLLKNEILQQQLKDRIGIVKMVLREKKYKFKIVFLRDLMDLDRIVFF